MSFAQRQPPDFRRLNLRTFLRLAGSCACLLVPWMRVLAVNDFAGLLADRTAVERLYHQHRIGPQPAIEEFMPAGTLEALVRADLKNEAWIQRPSN